MATRGTYVLRDGKLVPKHEAAPLSHPGAPSDLPRPFVVSDGCEFVSMVDGSTVTSKSRYRADLRARGYEEVGNERPKPPQRPGAPGGVKDDLRRAISQLGG
jgi:hypothetical protein